MTFVNLSARINLLTPGFVPLHKRTKRMKFLSFSIFYRFNFPPVSHDSHKQWGPSSAGANSREGSIGPSCGTRGNTNIMASACKKIDIPSQRSEYGCLLRCSGEKNFRHRLKFSIIGLIVEFRFSINWPTECSKMNFTINFARLQLKLDGNQSLILSDPIGKLWSLIDRPWTFLPLMSGSNMHACVRL